MIMIERRLRYMGLCCHCFLLFMRGVTVWALSKKYQSRHHFLLKWESVYNCVRLSETAVLTLMCFNWWTKNTSGPFHDFSQSACEREQRRATTPWKLGMEQEFCLFQPNLQLEVFFLIRLSTRLSLFWENVACLKLINNTSAEPNIVSEHPVRLLSLTKWLCR